MSNDSPPTVHAIAQHDVPVIDLSKAPGAGEEWGKPKWIVFVWAATEQLVLYNPWQISSKLRIRVLRLFGADIGREVIIRPRTRIRFPWNVRIGDRTWIGDGVWIHNRNKVEIGHDAVISQGTFVTTGSHAYRHDMGVTTKPVTIREGVWVTSQCVITGGVTIGRSAVIQPLTRVTEDVPTNAIYGSPAPTVIGTRFRAPGEGAN